MKKERDRIDKFFTSLEWFLTETSMKIGVKILNVVMFLGMGGIAISILRRWIESDELETLMWILWAPGIVSSILFFFPPMVYFILVYPARALEMYLRGHGVPKRAARWIAVFSYIGGLVAFFALSLIWTICKIVEF